MKLYLGMVIFPRRRFGGVIGRSQPRGELLPPDGSSSEGGPPIPRHISSTTSERPSSTMSTELESLHPSHGSCVHDPTCTPKLKPATGAPDGGHDSPVAVSRGARGIVMSGCES